MQDTAENKTIHQKTIKGKVLTIAGSDPSGGAGIQADIKTISAMGAYAMAAITSLTVQNTLGVTRAVPVEADLVRDQALACLEDIGADAIKSGMLFDEQIICTVSDLLKNDAPGIPYILDPVMVSTSGHALLAEQARAALTSELLPLATLVTPNIPEALALTGMDRIDTVDHMKVAAEKILALGAKAVLVKGGHLSDDRLVDLLAAADGTSITYESRRIETRHTHGTGCTLASAIAAGLAQGMDLAAAVERARDYVHLAIQEAPGFGGGNGPLNHLVSWAVKG
ncbi:bifunctional hydroxymethylpyrimidine kinase/phosphomethylpyrimidine kinase [Emcibacter sp.]|uniref:bifunctional hydroxymethylpyrimidine kinase/phosphomethylpyrimidine kinase n=1 Tax=Emcibacter sp. TaxID=1979954 RepID=UPI002AA78228|nr:bifunctional hydroxymethylpyrimidine kinase/phosphomethylpyrimidine kinase [Emcibacter sp.]